MLYNYLKIALRNLRRHKISTVINIGGLALGLACCILLFLFVRHEWTYDRFHEKADRLYRVVSMIELPQEMRKTATTPVPLAEAFEREIPGIAQAVRLLDGDVTVSIDGRSFFDQPILFVDSTFFEVYSFSLRSGAAISVLDEPGGVVLSETLAQRFFGAENAIGRELEIDFNYAAQVYRVTGVAKDAPANSTIPIGIVLPFSQAKHRGFTGLWPFVSSRWVPYTTTHILLEEGASVAAINQLLPAFVEAHYGNEVRTRALTLQPLTGAHLSTSVPSTLRPSSNPLYAWILAGIALVVLLLACVNFTTLALGRSVERVLEVGVRKTVGAQREQVALQFLSEAILTALGSILLGVVGARLFLPVFNQLTQRALQFDALGDPVLWLLFAGLVLIVGLLAGGYPAWVLSRFQPVRALKGRYRFGRRNWMMRLLIVVQFAAAVVLVTGVLVMAAQMHHTSQKDLGFAKDGLVAIEGEKVVLGEHYRAFREEVGQLTSVDGVFGSTWGLLEGGSTTQIAIGDTIQTEILYTGIEEGALDVLQVDMVEGRDLAHAESNDAVLVNEAFVEAVGWEEPIGQTIPVAKDAMGGNNLRGKTIVGVVEDFHIQSLHDVLAPLVLTKIHHAYGGNVNAIYVRMATTDLQEGLRQIQTVWEEVVPYENHTFTFVNDLFMAQYENELRWQALIRYATLIALLIACFGLFGLVTYAAKRRTKEIGIRKVLGASVPNIVGLLSKEFLMLVAIAALIAAPLSWLAAQRWLQNFAYHIDLGPLLFIAAGLAALAIALATVSIQATRAALADPVEALRNE